MPTIDAQQLLLKKACEDSHLAFTRVLFKERDQVKFILNEHHKVIADTLDRVFKGEITRLIINVPPGFTKTEMVIQQFVARGLALYPTSRYMHTSYSNDLALLNSSMIKNQMQTTDMYQQFWPVELKKDAQSKKMWYTEYGGGIYAVAMDGQVTGFRAGRMEKGFSGALLIDDPLKPKDAYSQVKREKVNRSATDTFIPSRLAHNDIPVIVIMQRLHEDDFTGHLLNGATGEIWHHLVMPAEIKEDYVYPQERYPYGKYIPHGLKPGPLWEYKMSLEKLNELRQSDPYTTSAQYDQEPAPLGGGIFKDEFWRYYNSNVHPEFEYRFITGDTAQKTKEHNDYSVFMCFGVKDNKLFVIDLIKGKWESPELKIVFVDFWNKHAHRTSTAGSNRGAYIEDKTSGTDLIQNISKSHAIPIIPVQRSVDKVVRAMDTVPYVASGYVYLPEEAHWLSDFKHELRSFTPTDVHKHDDQVDAFMDGVMIGLMPATREAGTF